LPAVWRSIPHCNPLPSTIARPRPDAASAGARQGCGRRGVLVADLDAHLTGGGDDPDRVLGPGVHHRVRRELVRSHDQRVSEVTAGLVRQQGLDCLPQEAASTRDRWSVRLELLYDRVCGHFHLLPPR